MQTLSNMGLTAWDLASDPYSHTQLAANFEAIDEHDHTAGKGVQIPTSGIVNSAVTTVKLADNSVTTAKIVDGTIALTDLSADLLSKLMPIGACIPWWRPNTSTGVPVGWVIADGASYTAAQHGFAGGGTIVVPDLTNKFILGATLDAVGVSDPALPPPVGSAGGGHTKDLSHSHGGVTGDASPGTSDVPLTTATASPNTDSRSPGTSSSSPGTSAESPGTSEHTHDHRFWDGGTWRDLLQRGIRMGLAEPPASSVRQTLYVPTLNDGNVIDASVSADMENITHSHTVNAHSHTVDAHSHTVDAHIHTVEAHSHTVAAHEHTVDAHGHSIPTGLSATQDIRPGFVGLLYIVKIKHS